MPKTAARDTRRNRRSLVVALSCALAISFVAGGLAQAQVADPAQEPFGWLFGKAALFTEMAVLLGLTSATLILFFRRRMIAALQARAVSEAALRESIRAQTSLHAVFLATDDMERDVSVMLHELSDAIRLGLRFPAEARLRLSLFGQTRDELGSDVASHVIARTIPHVADHGARFEVAYVGPLPLHDSEPAFTVAEERMLDLVASRIGGRALGTQSLRDLRRSEERFRAVFHQQAVATLILTDDRFTDANPAALEILGMDDVSDIAGRSPIDISPEYQPDGRSSAEAAQEQLRRMRALKNCRFEWEHLRKDGEPVLLDIASTTIHDPEGRPVTLLTFNDITVRRHAEQALGAYQRTLEAQVALRTDELSRLYSEVRAIVATAGSGIALVRNRRFVSGNPALARMLLADETVLPGSGCQILFRDQAEADLVMSQTEAGLAAGATHTVEQEFIRRDGSSFWGRLRATLVDPDDPSSGAVWVLDDITPDRNARQELAQAREIAEQAVLLKSEFLAQMSHEIRSPINAVLGFTELLLNTPLSGLQLDYLRKVQTSGRHLLMIINDILDLSKVEAGKLQIEATEFDLGGVLTAALDTITQTAADKDIEVLVDVDPDIASRYIGDPLRITQILINYLSNAIKFTAAGEIVLTVRPEAACDGRPGLRFTVRDSGIGMSPDQLERLFSRFTQADPSTARKYGGTGLGLAICKHLALLMDGDLGADSRLGAGSSFWLTLPLIAVDTPRKHPPAPELAGRRALVIDDHAAARELVAALLSRAGMQAETADSCDAAMVRIEQGLAEGRPVDVVLVDRKMPGLSGVDCVRRIKALARANQPRTILLTKRGGQETLDLVASEGIDGLVTKPVVPDLLVERVRTAMTATARAALPSTGGVASSETAQPAPSGWAGLRALVVDDNAINRELAGAILAKQGFDVQSASNGAEGLEALLQQDFDVVLLDGHMPVMDGLEAARRIRALPTAKGKVPIIGLTGKAEDGDREAGLMAGMNAYLVKPVAPSALREVLERWVPHPKRRAPAGRRH